MLLGYFRLNMVYFGLNVANQAPACITEYLCGLCRLRWAEPLADLEHHAVALTETW